ncbi:hypothetical protein [Mucilaginibacter kameinonensis]|uniref:hypothetical protein n=1 Tax=Mucilaginibacter kameinonensis TaxID=452286 RepID=UPI000EF7E68E|nr:hypothetical protein [Mucilaginibacter kameinonensis]
MKFNKTMMACSILMIGLIAAGCKKEKYVSRDTSYLKPPPPDTTAPPTVDPTLISFDNADKADGWQTVGTPSIATSGQKEGAGYLKNTIANGSDFMQFIKDLSTPLDTKLTGNNGQFKFWWYVSDVSLLKADGSIEITSSGKSDVNESAWDVAPLIPTLKNGWNEIALNFSKAIKTNDGGADYSAINHFRIFFFTTSKDHGDLVTGVDDLVFRAAPAPPPVVFDNADKADGWQTVGTPTIATSGQKEGAGYLKNTIANGSDFMQFIKDVDPPINTSFGSADGRFTFWWYVSDVSLLKADGSIEITSSGKSDDHESAWDVAPLIPTLKNGWNQITLDFDKSIKTGDGGADYTKINHFRIFFFTQTKDHTDLISGVDDLKFISK